MAPMVLLCVAMFQSAPPAREATLEIELGILQELVSIRASRAGGDFKAPTLGDSDPLFQSAPPAREATSVHFTLEALLGFQSAPPAREATFEQ